jgi:phenylacetate-CoA ligase
MTDSKPSHHPASAPDFVPAPLLRALQLDRVRAIVAHAFEHVELFRQRMQSRHVAPTDLENLADIAKLPFTTKTDLRDTYPFGLFASPLKDVVRVHASSGTTGKPIVVAYTKDDVAVWTSVMVRSFAACGLHEGDIIQNAYGYGLFTGGLGAHYGAEGIGATVIPISGGNTDRQIMVLKDFGVTAICCTPTYFLHLIDRANQLGVDLRSLPLRAGVFGAEPWTQSMRKHIESVTNIQAFDIYGLSEIIGPGVAVECTEHDGLHVFEDHFYPEIIDPETGKVLPDGEEGELVLTTLSKWAMPMIRYRTRDITALLPGTCACGRTLRRMRRIGRRSDDMLIVRGVNVYPSQIESALLEVEGTLPHYQIEVTAAVFSDRVSALEALADKIVDTIERVVGIRIKVTLVEPQTLKRSEGKAKRVFDKRGQP